MAYMCNDDYLDDEDKDVMYSRGIMSSDSEDDTIFAKKLKVKAKKKDDSNDDFEKEMDDELTSTMLEIRQSFTKSAGHKKSDSSKKNPEFYDNIYFDTDESSDEESGTANKKTKEKRKILSDDELLYDPLMDNEDEEWIEANRKKKMFGTNKSMTNVQSQKLPNSDAVLNCPACFTTLCFDCQRHEVYKDQYRAMFVSHCFIEFKEELSCPLKVDKKEKFRKRKREDTPEESSSKQSDVFHPVRCEVCNTKVAVYDKDEVYHFFNVLSSF